MIRLATATLVIFLLFIGTGSLSAAPAISPPTVSHDAPPATSPAITTQEINRLVNQLGDKDFHTRDAADKTLRTIAWPALPALLSAKAAGTDPEMQTRISAIAEDICWSTGSLSPRDAQLIASYRAPVSSPGAPRNTRLDLERQRMLRLDGPGRRTTAATLLLARSSILLGSEALPAYPQTTTDRESPPWQQQFADLDRPDTQDELEWTLACCGNYSQIVQHVRQHHDGPAMLSIINFLDQTHPFSPRRINQLKMALLMATEKYVDALKLAQSTDQNLFLLQLLAQRQDWKQLAENPYVYEPGNSLEFAPPGALLFSGDTASAEAFLRTHGGLTAGGSFNMISHQLVLLGRPDLIQEGCLARGDANQALQFLLLEHHYDQAFALPAKLKIENQIQETQSGALELVGGSDIFSGNDGNSQIEYRLLLARVQLNDLDQAVADIKRLDKSGVSKYLLNRADMLMGNKSAVIARLQISGFDKMMAGERCAEPFGPDMAALSPWSYILWRNTNDISTTFIKLDQIAHGKMPADELCHLADSALKSSAPDYPPIDAAELFLHAAFRLDQIGRNDLAQHYLDLAINGPTKERPTPPLHTGSLKDIIHTILVLKYSQLPRQFLTTATARPDCDPALQFLAAVFQEKLGDAPIAQKLRQAADGRLGADVGSRLFLAQTLYDLGQTDLARAQAELITQIDEPVSLIRYSVQALLGRIDQDQGHFAQALQHYRLAYFATFVNGFIVPVDYESYFRTACDTVYCETRVAISQNNHPAALQNVANLLALDPENLALILPVIQALKDNHWSDDARTLTAQNRAQLESTLKLFPNSHLQHYLIAKLDLTSRFITPQSLDHLSRALQLAPFNSDYLALKAQAATQIK